MKKTGAKFGSEIAQEGFCEPGFHAACAYPGNRESPLYKTRALQGTTFS